jgi:hypothetical protein
LRPGDGLSDPTARPLHWSSGLAPVAQWIEQRFPKPRAQVRFLPGALLDAWVTVDRGPRVDPDDVARVPGAIIIVPLAPSRSGDLRKCRPIGIYQPSRALAARYEEDSRQ